MTTATPGKLNVQTVANDEPGIVCLRLSGVIDERFDAQALFRDAAPITILNLEEVKRITSFGVRQWTDAMKNLPSSVRHLYLLKCPPCFIDQLNMVLNFGGRAEVLTATAVYFCEKCQEERLVPIDVLGDRSLIASGKPLSAKCPECQGPLQLEDDPQQYFRFAVNFGAQALEPRAAGFLKAKSLYQAREVGQPPQEIKLVDGDVTLFKISGTLDARWRPRRLASGVEGNVVFDLGEVGSADDAGAQRWGQLIADLTPGATSIVIVDLPDSLLQIVGRGTFTLENTVLHSVRVKFRCAADGTESFNSLTPGPLDTKPTMACPRCGKPSPMVTTRTALEMAFALATKGAKGRGVPAPVAKVIDRRAELLSRAMAAAGGKRSNEGDSGGLGRYKVIKPLSQGGMAEILLAVHQGIGGFEKLIALKKIRREMLERKQIAIELFLNEAKIAANLNHPNIVQTFEVGEHGGDLFIAMEYVHGVDVREILRASRTGPKKLSIEQILFIGSQVAAALNYAHTASDLSGRKLNIVHRDVSLSNIVVGFDGQVKLVDFGVATASVVGASPEGLIGKVSYMSPEQVASGPLDGRSDLFSLGVVMYEMITAKPLFRRETDGATLLAVVSGSIPPLGEYNVPSYVEQAILKALARDREQRYADGRAMELALADCLQRLGATVNTHDIAQYMKGLFGEQAAIPPTATPAEDAAAEPVIEIHDLQVDDMMGSGKSHTYEMSPVPWDADQGQTIVDSQVEAQVKAATKKPGAEPEKGEPTMAERKKAAEAKQAAAAGGAAAKAEPAKPAAEAAPAKPAAAKPATPAPAEKPKAAEPAPPKPAAAPPAAVAPVAATTPPATMEAGGNKKMVIIAAVVVAVIALAILVAKLI